VTNLALPAQHLVGVSGARATSIVETILGFARLHEVAYQPTLDGAFAADVSRLSDAEVVPDAVEDLLQALTRAGVITHELRLVLHAIYLREGER
jgi:formylmethanofuran dehydrogenase subunit E-like metal-binding protein